MARKRRSRKKNEQRRKLAFAVLSQFRTIYGSVRHQHKQVEESCGISGAQLWILHEVQGNAALGISELAVRLSIHQSTCSQLVEKLVRRKMLLRNPVPGDKRRVRLTLTKHAEKCLSRAPGPAEGLLPKALLGVSDASLRALRMQLAKVLSKLGETDARYGERPLSDL